MNTISNIIEKRSKLFEDLNLNDGKETALVIDTYKFLDLLPCNQNELKSMGYSDLNLIQQLLQNSNLPLNVALQLINQQLNLTNGQSSSSSSTCTTTTTTTTTTSSNDDLLSTSQSSEFKSKYPTPDMTQMIPYKAVRSSQPSPSPATPLIPPLLSPTSMHQSSFAFPTMIIDLIKRLPPPYCYNVSFMNLFKGSRQYFCYFFKGPQVIIEDFMQHFIQLNLPNGMSFLFLTKNQF